LHGHNHTSSLHRLAEQGTPVVGVASASAKAGAHKPAAAYHLFLIERRKDRVAICGRVRGLREDGDGFADLGAIDI
jgi:hypothetical protein